MTANTKLFDGVVIFTQVVNSGGFSAAAQVTGHSTSYISKEINKLEARLGVRLLNRSTRSIGLTSEGQVYFEQCQQMVLDAQQALGELSQGHIEPKGGLKISCPVAFAEGYLQPVLSTYLKRYPQVTLDVDLNDRKVDVVQDGFDLAIRATGQLEESSLICRKIYSCKGYTVATAKYLALNGTPTKPEQLSQHACICYANHKMPTRWSFKSKAGKETVVDVRQSILCNSAKMELAMVLDDHGICRLPAFAMEQELQDKKLEILFPDYVDPDINVYVVYASRQHLSPKIRCLIDLLVENISPQSARSTP
jgi:DNA-binding transcriptional LysR family regulator